MATTYRLILASGSPRRRELLKRAGYDFEVIVSHAEEEACSDTAPERLAVHNACIKARSVSHELSEDGSARTPLVIGADTIVVHRGTVFGKPADEETAHETLAALSGDTHQVITGVCLSTPDNELVFAETTDVVFRRLSDTEIDAYIATGEPMDKAGAYGIQGGAAAFVDHIDGDYDNVVGLPVARLVSELDRLGVPRARTSGQISC